MSGDTTRCSSTGTECSLLVHPPGQHTNDIDNRLAHMSTPVFSGVGLVVRTTAQLHSRDSSLFMMFAGLLRVFDARN